MVFLSISISTFYPRAKRVWVYFKPNTIMQQKLKLYTVEMKILHLCFSSGWGGLEKYSVMLAGELQAKGHTLHYLCVEGSRIQQKLKNIGVDSTASTYIKYIDIPLMLLLRRLIIKGGYEVVHLHMSQDLGIAVPALVGLNSVKLFFSLHMIVPAPKKDIYHRFQYKRVQKIFALGEAGQKSAIDNLPIKRKQVMELPYGFEIEKYLKAKPCNIREEYQIGSEEKIIGIFSRIEILKGQMDVIKALPKILEKFPNTTMVIAGDETEHLKGTILPLLKEEVKKLGIDEKVKFIGYRDDVPETIKSFDIFLLPSHFESYSISAIEAKLCGVPVVGTSVGGIPQNLGYGEFGLLVEPKNPSSIADGIVTILQKPEEARERAEKAKADAIKKHDKKIILATIEKEYLAGG